MANVFLSPDNVLANGHDGMIDVRNGGQLGFKRDPEFWFHNSLYVRQPIITVLISEPKGFRWLPDGDILAQMLKSLVELHCISVSGLNQSITNEMDEKVVGANANNVMQTPTGATRERTSPTLAFPELDGKPVTKLMRYWSEMLINDPESQAPGVAGLDLYIADGSPTLTPRDRSASMLFIEPTHNRLNVNSVYMCSNMMPLTIPDEISSEKGAAGESPLVEIEFSALTTVKNLDAFAKSYLDSLNKGGFAPSALGLMESEFSPNISDDAVDGFRTGVDKAAQALG